MAKKIDLTKTQGATGTTITNGIIIGEEYNPKLRDKRAILVYDEMISNDATVNAALDIIKEPLKGADYEIDAASDDAKDIEIADLVRECLFEVVDWDQFLEEFLTFLEYGHDVHEMIFEPRNILGKDRIALVELGYRKQTTITKWEKEDGQPGIHQIIADGHQYDIDDAKLVVITYKRRGNNWQGKSLLRTAYKHWYYKDEFYKFDAVANQRSAVGVIDVTWPAGAQEADKKKIEQAARNLRASSSGYVGHPEGYTIEFMDMKSGSLRNMEPSINHHDRQIMKNVLAQFMEIGAAGSSGTRGVGEDQSRILETKIKNIAKSIVYVIQNRVIKTLVDLNFTDVKEYPKLRVPKISDEDVTLLSDAVTKFVTAGVIHPRADDENTTRKLIGWPQLSDDELEEIDYSKGKPVETTPLAPTEPAPKTDPVNPEKAPIEDIKASAAFKAARELKDALYEKIYGTTGHIDTAA